MLVAPSEPSVIKTLGTSSSAPERYGVDIFWASKVIGTVGVQRKAFPSDFLASVSDGRLAKEVAQMQALDIRVLVLEGRPRWTVDGELTHRWGQPWNRTQHRRFLWSMRQAGIWVDWSEDQHDTVALVRDLHAWGAKAKHGSLMRRPAAKGTWGKPTSREFQLHVIQGLPDVGSELAERILDTLGMPMVWRVTVEDLMRVHGLGRKKAEKIFAALDVSTMRQEASA